MIRDQLFATGAPGILKGGGYKQWHARPRQDQSVMYRMQKGTWARRTGSGAAGVWVGGWLALAALECHQPLRRKRTPRGGGCCAAGTSLHQEPQHNHATLCADKLGKGAMGQALLGGGGGAFGLPLACSDVELRLKNGQGASQVRCRPPLPGSSSALLPLGCALDNRCWMGASRWRLSVDASWPGPAHVGCRGSEMPASLVERR
jgi:hypothetical protein